MKPYRFTGPEGTHLGRHGILKKDTVIWLDQNEQKYLLSNPSSNIKQISDAEAAKLKLKSPVLTGDNEPSDADNGLQKNSEGDTLEMEISEMEKTLIEDFTKKELVAQAEENQVDIDPVSNKDVIAKALAPVLVAKNRAEAEQS